jgi:hypothetical protein
MSIQMQNSLEMDFEFGIGPQLVIIGAILGSIFVGFLSYIISNHIFDQVSITSPVNTNGEQLNSNKLEPSSATQSEDRNNLCHVSNKFSKNIQQWCQEISFYSTQFGLPPDLTAAVMLQESGGNPKAYSHSGAVGLMQIMPRDGIAATFMCINGPCFSNRPTIKELEDPEFNIEFGTRMLAGLISKYGNVRDALKFYGPMDVGYSYADKVLEIYDTYR